MYSYRNSRRLWRKLAPAFVVCFTWSSAVAPAAEALTMPQPQPAGHMRDLSLPEMAHIYGRTGHVTRHRPGFSGSRAASGQTVRKTDGAVPDPGHVVSVATDSGSSYPWEGTLNGTNTGNGNKLTSLPLCGWNARGGQPVGITLFHNSEGNHNSELGQKWTFTYDIYLEATSSSGGGIGTDSVSGISTASDSSGASSATVHWGNDLSYAFTQNIDGSYSAPVGIHDTLVANGSPVTSYDLTTKDQIRYRFTNPNGTGWYCTSIVDPNGNTVTITRNTGNYVTSVSDPTGRTITLGYDSSNRITTITDPLSRTWTISYNASNELTQVAWPAVGGTTYTDQFAYNTSYDIATHTDRRGNSWSYAYYSDNSLQTETDPLQHQTSYTYTSGQTVITDPNGHTIKHNYSNGLLVGEVDGANYTESYQYDSSYNKTQVTDRRGHASTFTYDTMGNTLTATDALSHTTTTTYNTRNEPLTVTTSMGAYTANTYDACGNLVSSSTYDPNNVLISTATSTYNSDGTVATKTDSNNHTTYYGYDTNGTLTTVTTPGGHETSVTPNAIGVTLSRTDAEGATTSYTLDAWCRPTVVAYPDSSTHTFVYDANGNVTQFTDATGTTTRTYDVLNRMTQETTAVGTVTYAYDGTGKIGLLSSVTDAAGRTITYTYTARNQISTVTDAAGTASYAYDANGSETGITNQNGTTVTRVYDNVNRLTSVTNRNSGNTILSSFAYGYNNDNLRTSVSEADGSTVAYAYDAAHRLIGETRTGTGAFTASYTLDGTGNRTSQTVNGVTTTFAYSSDDELLSTTGGLTNTYTYNANGEQTGRVVGGVAYTLAYDDEGQLTGITSPSGSVDYAYDATGRRVSRTAGGTATQFVYGPGGILQERQGSTWTAAYTYGSALLRRNSEVPLYDALGSERTVTDGSGSVTGSIAYEAFGQAVATSGSSSSPYTFAATSGYRNDGDAGLTHVGARYYDAQAGRFVTRDTVLDQHPYLYCGHDPVNALDPSGHYPTLEQLAKDVWDSPVSKIGTIGAIGTVVEDYTPPHTIGHGIGGTLAGGATAVVGVGLVAAAATATAPVFIVGGAILGTCVAVGGVVHIVRAWFD